MKTLVLLIIAGIIGTAGYFTGGNEVENVQNKIQSRNAMLEQLK